MAMRLECSDCGHAQVVGVIVRGPHSSFGDPKARCEGCGAIGKFMFAPGYRQRMCEQAIEMGKLFSRTMGGGDIELGDN